MSFTTVLDKLINSFPPIQHLCMKTNINLEMISLLNIVFEYCVSFNKKETTAPNPTCSLQLHVFTMYRHYIDVVSASEFRCWNLVCK